MRIVLVALTIALLAIPAQAQQARGKPQPAAGAGQQQAAEKKRKAAEEDKAAKAAIERLPDKKFDPWRTVR